MKLNKRGNVMSTFQKATKKKRKLRMAIFGASGSGKTYSALRLATGFGGSIAFIDTERSAELYADKFDFDIAPLDEPTIDNLIAYINEAKNYKVLIIDSFSHSWRELLEDINKIAKTKYSGNSWSAWSDGTPKQNHLIQTILTFPGHLIVCMRSKTEWVIQKDEKTGKNKPERVGLAPEQGKGIEYEFDMLLEMSTDHIANVIKDRTGKYQDKLIELPDEKLGRDLIDWLNTGEEAPKTLISKIQFDEALKRIADGEDILDMLLDAFELTETQLKQLEGVKNNA